MLRIWSWDVNGRHVWDRLRAGGVDVALLQEAPIPAAAWEAAVVPDPATGWETAGWSKPLRTAVVAASPSLHLDPLPLTSSEERAPGALAVSRRGTLAAANVAIGGERITLVSLYAGWETSVLGGRPGTIYADAAAHRLLSDLAGLVDGERSHRIVAAGDLNILHRYGERGNRYWGARYATVFDRAETMGLRFVGPQAPNGRQASPRPGELPADSRDVPTYHTVRQGPMGATRQLDFVFASRALADRLTVRGQRRSRGMGPSDHCRVEIDLQP